MSEEPSKKRKKGLFIGLASLVLVSGIALTVLGKAPVSPTKESTVSVSVSSSSNVVSSFSPSTSTSDVPPSTTLNEVVELATVSVSQESIETVVDLASVSKDTITTIVAIAEQNKPAVDKVVEIAEKPTTPDNQPTDVAIIPEQPVDPANPTEEPKPETPVTPEVPVQPETPVTPEVPVQPETPVTPEVPVQPETPVTPEQPTEELSEDEKKLDIKTTTIDGKEVKYAVGDAAVEDALPEFDMSTLSASEQPGTSTNTPATTPNA